MGAKRRKHEDHENHERWLVSYADFITLLFAFFAVLYATSQQDIKKEQEFEQSVRKQFSGFFGSGSPDGDFNTENSSNNLIQPPLPTFPPPGSGTQEVQQHVQRKLGKEMSEEEYADVVEAIRPDAYGVRIQLDSAALFTSASADLKEQSVNALEKIASLLKDSNRKIVIEGHTDNEPIHTSRYPSNWELSAARATKIARFVIQRLGVNPKNVVPVAYGSNKPLVPNTTPVNRAKNRRIEIMILNTDEASL